MRTVLAGLSRVLGRFPFVCLAALVGSCAAILAVDTSSTAFANVIMACGLGLPVMFALRIVAERRFPGRAGGLALEVAGILAVAAYAWSVPMDSSRFTGMVWIRYSVLLAGLHFAVAFTPCLAGAGEDEYWHFNWRLFTRFALTTLYSAVLWVGLAAALASCDKLFDLKIDLKRYGELWIVMAGLFHPLFFLSGVPPARSESAPPPAYPGGLRAFAQFALAPLVVVYVAILYAYAGRIVAQWAWPHGWIAMPVCVLAVSGILAALLLQPARALETDRWAWWYWRYFFKALAPLSVLLILSIWRRESEYGFTEWRYYGLVTGLWLLATSLYYSAWPRASTRVIPASLAAVSLLTAWGPWGVFSVCKAAQRQRLVAVLGPSGFEKGRIVPASGPVPQKEVESLRSIVSHLVGIYGVESISDLLPADLLQKIGSGAKGVNRYGDDYQATQKIVDYATGGAKPASAPQFPRMMSVDIDSSGLPVAGYARVYHARMRPGQAEQALGDLLVRCPAGGTMPEFRTQRGAAGGSDVASRIRAVEDAAVNGSRRLPAADMSATVRAGPREWLVVIDRLGMRKFGAARPTLTDLDIFVLEK